MTEMHDPNQLTGSAPDVAPLAWVIDEIRTSLNAAVNDVKGFLGNKQNLDQLRNARNQVHQATGALQLLDLRGVALLTEAVEQLVRRWEGDPRDCLPAAVRAVETTVAAVIAYLEGLLSGRPNQPIRLFPYYRDVLQLNRAPRIHPADLIFPDLSRRPAFHQIEVRPITADQLRVRRVRFEEGLLGFLRNAEDARSRRLMRDALYELEHLPQRGLARSFWWIVRGLMEALDARAVPVDLDLKRVLARLNLQLRRLIEGGGAVAERLMIDALFYVGRADDKVLRVAEVKRLYGLDALIPADYERATLTAVDADALRTLKEALTHAKNLWGQLVAAATPDAAKFGHEIGAAREAALRVDADAAGRVLEAIGSVTANFGKLAPAAREALGLEVASALLFVELGVDDLPQVDPEYAPRAQAVIERMFAASNGQALPESGPWLSELARRAQDRLTMGTVVAETQATLREIEQRLDRFFRDPNQRGELGTLAPMFDQICGVLSVLGFEEPVSALRNVQQSVKAFENAATPADAEEFHRIAGNLGAVGFFVESLSQDGERPRGMFRYDPATGMFSADLGQPQAAETVAAPDDDEEYLVPAQAAAAPAEPAPPAVENVEASAEEHLTIAHRLSKQIADGHGDARALLEIARVLPLLAGEADLLDDAALKTKATRAVQLLSKLKETRSRAVAQDLVALLAPTEAPVVEPSAPLPTTQAAADSELHQIFVEEANEVLDGIQSQLMQLHSHPDDAATLTTVRRAFHTLKGSSRMVGLKNFGEGAWAIEQCFNLWLAQERPATEDLIQLADAAYRLMRQWITQIAANPAARVDEKALVQAAQRVREGGAFEFPGALPATGPGAVTPPKTPGSEADNAPPALPEENSLGGAPTDQQDPSGALLAAAAVMPDINVAPGPGAGTDANAPSAGKAEEPSEEVRRIGPIEISHGLYSVFLNEADECIRALTHDIAEWRFEPERPVARATVRHAHSLAGISATVGLTPVWSIADPLDDLMHELSREDRAAPHAPLAPAQFDTLERAFERIRGMLHQFAAGVYPDGADLEASAVRELLATVRAQAQAEPMPPAPVVELPAAAAPEAPRDEMLDEFDALPSAAGFEVIELADDAADTPAEAAGPRASTVRDELDPDLLQVFMAEASDLLPGISANLRTLAAEPNRREVARDLMRQLHTVKGSARMAGAMRLGELVHDMETRIESAMQLSDVPTLVIEDLQSQFDVAQSLFDELQHPQAPAAPLAPVIDLAAARGEARDGARESDREVAPHVAPHAASDAAPSVAPVAPLRPATPAAPAAKAPAPPASFVRVRSDVLEKLVDQAGEVSISRSKVENEVSTLKTALTDLTENISRLRTQLREFEVQADAQVQARADQLSKESAAFDPLEFDRYTRLQELTRQLAESVEDVAMVQSNMLKGLQMADTDLTSQLRLTRDLQQQLMRVRLVPFSNISERLYRVARQAAKELEKRVNLEIRGGSTEVDRGVLERMAGPFEHLVRNAIVHGLEAPAQRFAAGKPDTGELAIEVRQEANEIVVVIADDGAGLALDRIYSRGVEKGLIAAGQQVSDRELMELIFAPGFSTAAEVTELAGRGVGMDVVRAELASFGGRIAVSSEAGRGTRFTLYLPLTLAVTQVVLATVGGRRYALPAGMVEQVRRFKPAQLMPALADGSINLAPVGEIVLRPLAQLLGAEMTTHAGKQIPVVLLRSGDDRLAVAVEDLSSNQEVVVKNVGPQVARLAGILGATILGNGEIVLIINPVQLIGRAPEPPAALAAAREITQTGHAERRAAEAREPGAPAVVMVVDDSLTVRRVTQRLLERQGYDVVLAKDGVDALRQLQDVKPDVMLVDIEMPRMDGYDLTRNVRASGLTRAIPIIMITSRTAEKHRNLAFEIGVNEYLGKPYQEEELLGLIKRYLAERAPA